MLLLLSERLFGLSPPYDCEDIGIAALRAASPDELILVTLCIPVAWCFARMEMLVSRPPPLRAVGDVQSPIVLGWVVFTFMSIVTLLQFGRAPVSYIMKFAHVACELLHLALLFQMWSWSGHVVATMTLALFSFAASASMHCQLMMQLTAIGTVLDTCNFLLCLAKPDKSAAFRVVTAAFFMHATYIWAFLLMSYSGIDALVLPLRVYGVWANCIAVDRGVVALGMVSKLESTAVSQQDNADTPLYTDDVVLFADNCALSTAHGKCAFRRTRVGVILAFAAAFAPGVIWLTTQHEGVEDAESVVVRAGPWIVWRQAARRTTRPPAYTVLTDTHATFVRFVSWCITLFILNFSMVPGLYLQCFVVAWFAPSMIACAFVIGFLSVAKHMTLP